MYGEFDSHGLYEMAVPSQHVFNPLVLNLWIKGSTARATVVEVERGTTLRNSDFPVSSHLIPLLGSKKRACENLLQYGRYEEIRNAMKDIGELVYTSVFVPLGLEHLFSSGGYRVSVHAQNQARAIPVELAYHDRFVFETNIMSLRGKNDPQGDRVVVERVLIIADPTARFKWALREGMMLYDFFVSKGLSVLLVSRPLTRERLLDLFSTAHIVHFCGHVASHTSYTGWDIGTGLFNGSDCDRLSRTPDLVFSSGCGNTLPLGLRFLTSGVRNCICTRWQIPDTDICSFVLAFYECLLRVGDIGLAFQCSVKGRYARGETLPLIFALQGESGIRYEESDF